MIASHFSSFQDFLAMGGYGAYVWSTYGIAGIVLVLQVLRTRSKH